MFICIAGKNNIAVDVLEYLISHNTGNEIGVICNRTESGINTWQKSLRWFAEKWGIKEYSLEDLYQIDHVVLLSLEFDQIIKTTKFKNDAQLFNIHFSLLPAYKGMYTSALPILFGEKTVGVTFHKIDDGIDTGDIISQVEFSSEGLTCRELYFEYIKYGTKLVISSLNDILDNTVISYVQPSENSTYYSRKSIDYKNLQIDLNQTASQISRQVRAFSFREYQLIPFNGKKVIACHITNIKSTKKPGTIISSKTNSVMVATIDYNVVLFFDQLDQLLAACAQGDCSKVYEICCIREHINAQNNKGWSPLIVATYHNQVEIAKYLINLGADIYVRNYNGTNLLMYAKDVYLRYGDKSLLILYKTLGLSEKATDYNENDLIYYLKQDGILNELESVIS